MSPWSTRIIFKKRQHILSKFNWNTLFAPNVDVQDALLDLFMTVGFVQLVKEPTRLDNVLDVVLTNTTILNLSMCNCEPVGSSDHLSVEFTVSLTNAANFKSMHDEDST